MKLSDLLKKHGATDFFIKNFKKEKQTSVLPSVDCVDDDSVYTEDYEYKDPCHPWCKFLEEYENLEDGIIDDSLEILQLEEPKDLILIKYSDNWADEIDVSGHFVSTRVNFESYIKNIEKYFENGNVLYYGIGSNEDIEYENIEDVKKAFKLINITYDEYKILQKLKLDTTGFTGPEID